MFSKHPRSTLATVSATLPVVLSSRPLGKTTAGGHSLDTESARCTNDRTARFSQKVKHLAVRATSHLHSLLLLQLPRLPLTIRRMVSRAVEDWLFSVAGETGFSADGGSGLPF